MTGWKIGKRSVALAIILATLGLRAAQAQAGVKLLTLNVQGRKASVSFVHTVLLQRLPDIACLTESTDHPEDFITAGLNYWKQNSSYVAILSKTPLVPLYDGSNGNPAPVPPNGDFINYKTPFPPNWVNNSGMGNRSVGARTTLATGEEVYVVCAHLDSNNYFTKPLKERNPVPGAAGAYRDGQINAILRTVSIFAPQIGGGRVVILGDFNAAAHLDWSWWISPYPPAGSGGNTTDGGADWTVSRILAGAGYTDAGRTSFQQVVTPLDWTVASEPLPTWPFPNGTDSYTPTGYKHERIDQIWFKGFTSPTGYRTLNSNTIGITPWSTDHGGVEVVLTP